MTATSSAVVPSWAAALTSAPAAEQRPGDAGVGLAGGQQQRRVTGRRSRVHGGAVREQRPDHRVVPLPRGPHQRGLAVEALRAVHVGAHGEERHHRRDDAAPRARHQRRLAGPLRAVRIGSGLEEARHQPRAGVRAGEDERRDGVLIRRVHVRPGRDQGLRQLGVVPLDGPVERGEAARGAGVHRGPLGQEGPHLGAVAVAGGLRDAQVGAGGNGDARGGQCPDRYAGGDSSVDAHRLVLPGPALVRHPRAGPAPRGGGAAVLFARPWQIPTRR